MNKWLYLLITITLFVLLSVVVFLVSRAHRFDLIYPHPLPTTLD